MSYDVYQPDGQPDGQPEQAAAAGTWRVAIEYSNQGQAKPPTLVQIGRTEHADRATALRAAERASYEFSPPDPWSEQSRQVFRDGPDGYLVILEGATSTFHMSVRIVSALAPPVTSTAVR
ncbi:hypothetical protein [Nocardioides nitrophenolicus]|uniref:hypothetical protein n=1 Tax=Nocardioides nitrophenolicus TaxID=60489 RepID=UPI001958EE28|nr:hypothetical protein [Nocardioides nitrophenolicus]MBM7515297.1 hypothetical protein [Nocardioides nitrophenolicus]